MNKLILISSLILFAFTSNAQNKEQAPPPIDREQLQNAGGHLENYSNMNATANVFYVLGFSISTAGLLSEPSSSEPINTPLVITGSVLTFTGWIISRRANKHIKRAGYSLYYADSGIGVKLVF